MNESIHAVAKYWYRLYWGIMVAGSLLVVGGALAYSFLPNVELVQSIGKTYRLDSTTLVIAVLNLIYVSSVYWYIQKNNISLATVIGSMLFVLLMLNGLVGTDPHTAAYVFTAGWLLVALFSGMFGLTYALGHMLLSIMYVLLESRFGIAGISNVAWALILGSSVFTMGGYAFWRNRYVKTEEQQVNRLSGMLRSNQEQSAIIIQSIADGVIVVSTDGKISLINLAAGLLTGWSIADATGVDVQLVVKLKQEKGAEIPKEGNPFTEVLEKKKPVSLIVQVISRDGSMRIVSLVISPVQLTGGDLAGAVAVMRDISEERAAEQQRAEFISTASHEMRTPVAAIEGYLALALNDKVSTVDSRARGFLEKAHASTQHLGKLFQDLLTSAKAEDGRLSSHPVVIDMGAFLEQLTEDLRFSAQKKGLSSEFVVGTGQTIDATNPEQAPRETLKVVKPLFYVHADPERLREVITNLFDNAVKYTEQGKVSIGLTGNTDVVQFYIRDTGPGIPSEDVPHLFQKFYRVDNSATRTIGGTGLGLFISRKIIELYQGRIWVESALGKGSTFFVNLPRLSTQRAAALQTEEASTAPPPTQAR
jgi:PAS domain S-box-containing protein